MALPLDGHHFRSAAHGTVAPYRLRFCTHGNGALPDPCVLYFMILLLHRERRDYAVCLEEYGRDWEAYCRKVRWRIVPGLY